MERDIPEQHAGFLKRLCRLKETDPLPAKVTEKYWSFKRCADRIQLGVTVSDLAHLCEQIGYGKPLPEALPTLAERFRRQEIRVDAPVKATVGKKVWSGLLKGVKPDGRVIVDIEGEQRNLAQDKVVLVEAA